jgi:hypothetical protein
MCRFCLATALCALAAGGAGCTAEGCPPFAHIEAVDFGSTGGGLWWTLRVREIPDALTFNQPDVPANFLEYRWAIDMDSDRDGAVDLRASIDHFAMFGAAPVTTADILSQTNENLLEVMGGTATVVATFSASITDNTFRFETTAGAATGLVNVTDRAQSIWKTTYRSGAALEDQCDEQFP